MSLMGVKLFCYNQINMARARTSTLKSQQKRNSKAIVKRKTTKKDKTLLDKLKEQREQGLDTSNFPLNPDWILNEENGYQLSSDNIVQVFYDFYLDLKDGKDPWLQLIYTMGARKSGKTHIINWFIQACFMTIPNTIAYVCRRKQEQCIKTKTQFISELKQADFPIIEKMNSKMQPQIVIENPFLQNTAHWNNQIIFKPLNPEKADTENGGGTGETTWAGAKLIIVFFEEATTHDDRLVRQFLQSLRGDKDTRIIKIYASNPWSSQNWYVKDFNRLLPPSIEAMEQLGYQIAFKPLWEEIDGQQEFLGNAFVWRSAIWLNPHLKRSDITELKALKKISPTQYKIAYLGIDGVAEGGLYTTALENMSAFIPSEVLNEDFYNEWECVAGLDWGDGTSDRASPTTIHLGLINKDFGLRVLKEFTYYNNKTPRTQVDIMNMCIQWLKEQYSWLQSFRVGNCRIKCFVDDAASNDFVQTFNNLLEPNGVNEDVVKFYPANKYDIKERVEVTNFMLGYKQLIIDKNACPMLYDALLNCKQVLPKNGIVNEDTPFRRDHDFTHWINSGVEYIMNDYFYKFRQKPAMMLGWDDIQDKAMEIANEQLGWEGVY